MKKSLFLTLITTASAALLPSVISCSFNKEEFIMNNIKLNNEDITIYDTLDEFNANTHLRILNSKLFKENDISLTLGESKIDYDKEVVQVKITYRTREDSTRKDLFIELPFTNFKELDSKDWKRVFEQVAKFTKIEWFGNGKYLLKNKYAKILESQFNKNIKEPKVEDFSYKLQLINSSKVSGEINDVTFNNNLTGGKIVNKQERRVLFKYPEGEDLLLSSIDGIFKKPQEIPTKENHVFIGWSEQEDAKEVDLFLEGDEQKIDDKTVIYPVFKQYATLVLEVPSFNKQEPLSYKLVLSKEGRVSKEQLLAFIDANIPSPKEKWSYDSTSISYFDSNNEKNFFSFDETNITTNKLQVGEIYKIEPNFRHEPIIRFKDAESNKVISSVFANVKLVDEQKQFLTPTLDLDFESFTKNGKNFKEFVYEENGERYEPNQVIEINKENVVIDVLIRFLAAPNIKIDTSLINNKLKDSKLYLNTQGKLNINFLPKIDYTFYKGEDKRIYKPNENGGRFSNNRAFDKRSNEQDAVGYEFDGWYLDAQYKIPLEFKDGYSVNSLINKTIYPKFKLSVWDKVRDAREIINTTFDILSSAPAIASVFVIDEKWIVDIVEKSMNVLHTLLYLSLGGKINIKGSANSLGVSESTKNIVSIINTAVDNGKANLEFLKNLNINKNNDNDLNKKSLGSFLSLLQDIFVNIFTSSAKANSQKFKDTFLLDKLTKETPNFLDFLDKFKKFITSNKNNITNILLLVFANNNASQSGGGGGGGGSGSSSSSSSSSSQKKYTSQEKLFTTILEKDGILSVVLDLITTITQAVTKGITSKAQLISNITNITNNIIKTSSGLYKAIKNYNKNDKDKKEEK